MNALRNTGWTLLIAASYALAGPAAATDGDRISGPAPVVVDPGRFGERTPDAAFGAYQRGLYLTALNLAMPRADEGDAAAQTLVAEIHARGLGVRRDEALAAQWYAKAAEQGIAEARFQLALILLEGESVPRDVDRAFELMEAAADAGNPRAQFNFAQMLMGRDPSLWGMEQAVSYYQLAAEAGVADAQYAMAQIYAEGIGGKPVDAEMARLWLTRAARQNFDTAQLDLGTLLTEDAGTEVDQRSGFAWLLQAALGGNVAAQNRVAKLYRAGIGVDADAVEAAAWYLLARRSGLTDPIMDNFLEGLSEDEIGEATRRVDLVSR